MRVSSGLTTPSFLIVQSYTKIMNTILFRSSIRSSLLRTGISRMAIRSYSDLNPANKKDYDSFVNQWHTHFKVCDDDFELERGLNHIFAADWVPSVEVIEEAIKATRRLNTFATAVRILEALEEKAYKKEQYQQYLDELKPMLEEYGIIDKVSS